MIHFRSHCVQKGDDILSQLKSVHMHICQALVCIAVRMSGCVAKSSETAHLITCLLCLLQTSGVKDDVSDSGSNDYVYMYKHFSFFSPYFKKDNIPSKLLACLMKMNISLIFLFTCKGFSGFPASTVGA